ncbi:MAG: S8 family serine peptidase [Gaiellaceae bacterium]
MGARLATAALVLAALAGVAGFGLAEADADTHGRHMEMSHAKGGKAGEAIVPPQLRDVNRLLAAAAPRRGVLVALERGRGGEGIVRAAGGVLLSRSLALWRVRASSAPPALRALRARSALRYAELDAVSARPETHWQQGDHLLNDQAELDTIRADVEPPGPGVPLTVIDTGLDVTHPEFAGRPNTLLLNQQSVPAEEGEDHGTAVASVAAAPANGWGMVGVYPNARLHSYDWPDDTCSGAVRALTAARRAAPTGVINASWSFPAGSCFALRDAVAETFGAGSVIVASAGNQGEKGNPKRDPAVLKHVLTVAATDVDDQPLAFSNRNLAVDLAAPGHNILVAIPAWFTSSRYTSLFDFKDGTSFSAPMVAAAAAWVWTVRPDLDRTQVFNVMRYSARDVYNAGFDLQTGFGMLNIAAALAENAPIVDPREPNDDIYQVKANGLFATADAPLTKPGRGQARIRALVDVTEDPIDVYRAWVPGRSKVTIRLNPEGGDVDLEVFRRTAKTVHYQSRKRALRGPLIDYSDRAKGRTEQIGLTNDGRAGEFVYIVAYLPEDGPLDGSYALTISTRR